MSFLENILDIHAKKVLTDELSEIATQHLQSHTGITHFLYPQNDNIIYAFSIYTIIPASTFL